MFAAIQEDSMNKEIERLNEEKCRNESKLRQLNHEIKALEAEEKGLDGKSGTIESSPAEECWKRFFWNRYF